jgi:hypothetical protein
MLNWIIQVVAEVVLGGLLGGSSQRPKEGVCARCRRNPATTPAPGSPSQVLVCLSCVRAINRNLRAGAWFFTGFGALMGTMWILGIAVGVGNRRPTDWGFLLIPPAVAAGMVLLGLGIRRVVQDPTAEAASSAQDTVIRMGGGRPTRG